MELNLRRLRGLQTPGLSVLDDVQLRPTFDLDFMAAVGFQNDAARPGIQCNHVALPAAPTATRASSALFFQNPPNTFDDQGSTTALYGNNVLRYGGGPFLDPAWVAAGYSVPERYNGLLIEGADQNVIVENTQYAAVNWTLAGCTCSDYTGNRIYDGRCFRLTAGAGEGYIQQTILLTGEKYVLCFLLGVTTRVPDGTFIRVAAGVSGSIAGISSTFEQITHGVYLAWAVFTATAANWDVGVNIRAGAGAEHIALISCYKAAPTNEGGDFPRSPIPSGAAATTRAADVFNFPGDPYVGLSQGTIDIEYVAQADAAAISELQRVISLWVNANNRIELWYDGLNLRFRHNIAAVAITAFGVHGQSRGDIVKVRLVYGSNIEGAKDVIIYISVGGAAWSELGSANGPIGGNLPANSTFWVGRYGPGNYHLSSSFRRLRIFNRALVGVPGW